MRHGIDWEGPLPQSDHNHVDVANIASPVDAQEQQGVGIDPLADSDSFGIDIYLAMKDIA